MVHITVLTERDLPALRTLYDELIGRPTDPDAMHRSFVRMQSNDHYILIGAKNDSGELVGSALGIICLDIIDQCKPWMVVENVIVSERARGLGAGRRLMEFLEERAREHGCSYITLTSARHREPAHRFYEAIGYDGDCERAFRKRL